MTNWPPVLTTLTEINCLKFREQNYLQPVQEPKSCYKNCGEERERAVSEKVREGYIFKKENHAGGKIIVKKISWGWRKQIMTWELLMISLFYLNLEELDVVLNDVDFILKENYVVRIIKNENKTMVRCKTNTGEVDEANTWGKWTSFVTQESALPVTAEATILSIVLHCKESFCKEDCLQVSIWTFRNHF